MSERVLLPKAGGGDTGGAPLGLLAALAAGLALRVLYLFSLAGQPFFGHLLVDAKVYDTLALERLAGRAAEGAFYRPPLYPLLLSGIYSVAGHSSLAVVVAQSLLGLATVVPVFLLARRWFGEPAATLAALLTAVYPLRIYYEGEHLDVTLVSFLLSAGMLLFWTGLERPSPFRLLLSGVTLGLASLTRPTMLAIPPFLLAGAYLALRRARRFPWRGVMLGAAALGLTVAPATIHNYRAEGRLIPVAAYGGINAYLGNLPGATGETPVAPGLPWEAIVVRPIREGHVSAGSQDAWWWREARRAIAAGKCAWLRLMGKKILLFWNARESSNNKSLPYFTSISAVTRHYRWWFGVCAVLAAAGLAIRRSSPGARFLLWLYAGFTVSVVPFFVTARYRIPMVPFLAIGAAAGLAATIRRVDLRAGRRTIAAAAAVLLAVAVVLPPWFGSRDDAVDPDFQMGQIHLMRGEPSVALGFLLRARARRPDDPNVSNALGATHAQLGEWDAAEGGYRDALRAGDYATVRFNLGVLFEKRGDVARAAAEYRRALEINPLDRRARNNLALLGGE